MTKKELRSEIEEIIDHHYAYNEGDYFPHESQRNAINKITAISNQLFNRYSKDGKLAGASTNNFQSWCTKKMNKLTVIQQHLNSYL